MFPSVWSSLFTVNIAAFVTLVSSSFCTLLKTIIKFKIPKNNACMILDRYTHFFSPSYRRNDSNVGGAFILQTNLKRNWIKPNYLTNNKQFFFGIDRRRVWCAELSVVSLKLTVYFFCHSPRTRIANWALWSSASQIMNKPNEWLHRQDTMLSMIFTK